MLDDVTATSDDTRDPSRPPSSVQAEDAVIGSLLKIRAYWATWWCN